MNAPTMILEKSSLSSDRETKITLFSLRLVYRLVGLVGVPLIVAVCLLLQLQKLPNSSLGYSLLYAVISLLFNVSSSALLKIF